LDKTGDIVFVFFRSFSYVFEASNTADNHRYAVKKMSCHTNDEEKRARDEVENYQRFSHTNLGLIRKSFF
jgi:serine/threonine protein kinase